MKDVIKELKELIEELRKDGTTILIQFRGDFNARVGILQFNEEGEASKIRNTTDQIVNNEGLRLIDF